MPLFVCWASTMTRCSSLVPYILCPVTFVPGCRFRQRQLEKIPLEMQDLNPKVSETQDISNIAIYDCMPRMSNITCRKLSCIIMYARDLYAVSWYLVANCILVDGLSAFHISFLFSFRFESHHPVAFVVGDTPARKKTVTSYRYISMNLILQYTRSGQHHDRPSILHIASFCEASLHFDLFFSLGISENTSAVFPKNQEVKWSLSRWGSRM